MASATQSGEPLYRYRFDGAEFDAARMSLCAHGTEVLLEQRPLQVLALLLQNVDEVVARETLFQTVWEGRPTVDNVLANAIAKLRKALGSAAGARVVNVPRVGYRLRGPVERIATGRHLAAPFALKAGHPVPGREHLLLHECLDPHAGGMVWRVRHDKTRATRVYKFAVDGEQLAALKREVTIHRVLRRSLGERDDFVRLIDWNFDAPPYWLQCEDAGQDLVRWTCGDSAFRDASIATRLGWFLQIADAVAAAHGAGVLHKDIKPANVLVTALGADWQLRVGDFGSGRLLEGGRLESLGITRLGMTVTGALPEKSGVTLLYLAPEVLAGQAPSVQSDVYALGLILFQMIAGDLHRTLAPGWEQAIDDALLREDIAAATHGDPQRRLQSVDELVRRLRSRDARMAERKRLLDSDARALAAERALERSRARRPWLLSAIAMLLLGLAASWWQIAGVRAARAEAQREAALADAANRFLIEDLLGAGAGGSAAAWYERNPSLREILDAAAGRLDTRFTGEPLVRASLHQTLGRAYRSTGDFAAAANQLQAAADVLEKTFGEADTQTILAQYELAPVLAHLSRFEQAGKLLDRADAAAGARRDAVSEIALRSHLARGGVAYQRMRIAEALPEYRAAERLQLLLHPGDAAMSAHILMSIAGCDLRMGNPRQAEAAARKVLTGPAYSQARIGLAAIATARSRLGDALRAQRRYQEAIPVVQQALRDYEKSEGSDSQGAIVALSSLSYLYSLTGDDAKALHLQRDVHQRAAKRWGENSQYALVELLNLGSSEYDAGDMASALPHLQKAESGLTAVSGAQSPTTQAARVALANAYSDLGRNLEALEMIRAIDPVAFQATTSDPGRKSVLAAMQARIELRLRRAGAEARLRDAIAGMEMAGVAEDEIATFRKALPSARVR